jgi:signal transduction histidine kinase
VKLGVKLGSTTQTQVALVVAGSVVLAHVVAGLIVWLLLHARQPEPLPAIGRGAATLLGELYDSGPQVRPAVLEGAARAGIRLRPLAFDEASGCTVQERPAPHDERFGGRQRAKVAICLPALADGVQTAFQTAGGAWLGVIDSLNGPAIRRAQPGERPPPYALFGTLFGTVLITVVLCVWASRRVTSPLLRLAEAAEQVDVEHGGTVPLTGGTWEIRKLADAFNGLIRRLGGYAADQRRLVAGVSHDLRTPLTRLRLRLDQVEDVSLRAKLLHDVHAMQNVVESSLSLIRAQDGGAQIRDVDVGALLATIVDNFTDSGADVEFTGPLHQKLRCDAALLTRAIENVVENALKFAGRAEVTLREEPGTAVIEVSDDGPGISEEQKQRVFEPFYRGDESRGATEGSGLGLSITRALIQAQGGTVTLHDAAPSGLCARLCLPSQ